MNMGAFPSYRSLDADDWGDRLDADVELGASYGTQPSLPVHTILIFPSITISSASSAHRNRSAGAGSAQYFADFVSAPPLLRSLCKRGSLLTGGSAAVRGAWQGAATQGRARVARTRCAAWARTSRVQT